MIINTLYTSEVILTSLADSRHNQYVKYLLLWIQCWDSWWWTVNLSETCKSSLPKQSLEIVRLLGFYYKNVSQCTVLWMSNSHWRLFRKDGKYRCKHLWLHTAKVQVTRLNVLQLFYWSLFVHRNSWTCRTLTHWWRW